MTALTQQEVSELGAAVSGELARVWPSPACAGDEHLLPAVWDVAAAQEWTALGVVGALGGALASLRELGRCACPLPLMDVYVASRLLCGEDAIVDGSIRPVVAIEPSGVALRAVEAAAAATHVLLLPREGAGEARLCCIGQVRPTPGLAIPPWSEVRVADEALRVPVDQSAVDEAKALLRLGLAVRAMAAAEAAHEFAVEHAKTRHAFGKPIGAFQAVAHRCSNAEIHSRASSRWRTPQRTRAVCSLPRSTRLLRLGSSKSMPHRGSSAASTPMLSGSQRSRSRPASRPTSYSSAEGVCRGSRSVLRQRRFAAGSPLSSTTEAISLATLRSLPTSPRRATSGWRGRRSTEAAAQAPRS